MELEDKNNKQKKTTRKNNKKNQKKDILSDIEYYEYEKNLNSDHISNYKNTEYLSPKEKSDFENKFSKPRNESQTKFLDYLKNKSSRIIIASGPAGTGKTLFGIEQGIKIL